MGKKQGSNDNTGKVITKYDKKVAKRKAEERKAKRASFIIKLATVIVLLAIVCSSVIAFSLKYYRIHNLFIKVDNENVSEIEFDYYYGMTKSTLFNTTLYGDVNYLSYFTSYMGYDADKKDKGQTYSGDNTWYDYFANQTVTTMKEYRALLKLADEANYEYTTADDDYNAFLDELRSAAEANDMSVKKYVKHIYGANATLANTKDYVMDVLKAQSYLEVLNDSIEVTDAEIDEYIANQKAEEEQNSAAQNTESTDNTDATSQNVASDDNTESTENTDEQTEEVDRDQVSATIRSQKYNEIVDPVMDSIKVDNIKNRIVMYTEAETESDAQ